MKLPLQVANDHYLQCTISYESNANVHVDIEHYNIEPIYIENRVFYPPTFVRYSRNHHKGTINNCDNIVAFDAESFLVVDDEPIESNDHRYFFVVEMAIMNQIVFEQHQFVVSTLKIAHEQRIVTIFRRLETATPVSIACASRKPPNADRFK